MDDFFFGDQEALGYCFTTEPAGITISALVDTSFPFLSLPETVHKSINSNLLQPD